MIKAVKNFRNLYKQIGKHKHSSDIVLAYILLIKKALAFEEIHLNHLKRYTNVYKLTNFVEFLKTNRYKELIQIYASEVANLEKTFNQLINYENHLSFPSQELVLIDSLCEEGIDVNTVNNWITKKLHILKGLLEDPKIMQDQTAEK